VFPVLRGLMIQKEHAIAVNTSTASGQVSIRPAQADARIFINGQLIKEDTPLQHNDRVCHASYLVQMQLARVSRVNHMVQVIIGAHHVFRFVHPAHGTVSDEKGMRQR